MNNRLFLYYKLQCKRIFRQIPHIFFGLLLLSSVIGTVSFFTGKLLYVNQPDGQLQIAYTSEDEHKMTNMFLNILTNSDSIASTCKFINTTQNEAETLLQREAVLAAIYIPPHFMDGLIYAENHTITISLPLHLSLYSVIMVELMDAVDKTLSAAQAGLYTLYDYYEQNDILEKEKNANKELNSVYLTQALNRSSTFQNQTVTATGDISLGLHLLCGGIVIVLLLLGCSFADYIPINNQSALTQKLLQSGISALHMILSRITAITLMLCSLAGGGMFMFWCCNQGKRYIPDFTGGSALCTGILNTALLCLCSASLIVFILSLTNNRTSGILLLFLIVILCGFLSGCLIPTLFLPVNFRLVGAWLPTTFMMNACKDIFSPAFSFQNVFMIFGWSAVFSIGAIMIQRLKK